MKFILPRLFGLALIAGIAALILTMIFKVLMGAAIIGTIAYFVSGYFKKRGYDRHNFGRHGGNHFGSMEQGSYHPFGGEVVVPVSKMQRSAGIIPIN